MRAALVAAVAAALLVAPPLAQAQKRYAAPVGSGMECSRESPCSLREAITKAGAGDEVIVTQGTYAVSGEAIWAPSSAEHLYVHGDFSAPMPRIVGAVADMSPIVLELAGASASYLEIEDSGFNAGGLDCGKGGRIDRVRVSAKGEIAFGIALGAGCQVLDSVIRAEGREAKGIAAGGTPESPPVVRNVTVVSKGEKAVGVCAGTCLASEGAFTVDVKNAIVSGEAADLTAGENYNTVGDILVSNSNYDVAQASGSAIIAGESNQTAAPLFVDAAAGDYREAPGSPTIDAGSTDKIGPLDLAGNPRTLGAAPDIGAYEFNPPPPPPPSIESLSLKPKLFRPANTGGAVISRARKGTAPVATTVRYALSSAGTVTFGVERLISGRRVGKKCVKQTGSNRDHRKCRLFKQQKGSFKLDGLAGRNTFRFSGRLKGRGLRPGSYRLVGRAGGSVKRAAFEIAR